MEMQVRNLKFTDHDVKGTPTERSDLLMFACRFTPQVFKAIRKRAKARNRSMAAEVRYLCEIALAGVGEL
jgi:hypothetical protein